MDALRPGNADARWVPAENLHCTLAFLGAVADERVAEVSDALARAVADHVDFPTALGPLGAFPSAARARVIWASLADAAGGIGALAGSVRGGLAAIGFEPDERPFRPHVTLARLREPRRAALAEAPEPVRFVVDRVVLYQSVLRGSRAPVYEPLATFPFRREPAPPRPD